jgi:hypothetical protein
MAHTKHFNHLGKRCAPPSQSESDSTRPHKAQKQEPEQDTKIPNSEIQMIPSQQLKRRSRCQKRASLKRQNAVDLEEGDERSVGQLARAAEEGDDDRDGLAAAAQDREAEKSGDVVRRPVHPGLVDGDGPDEMKIDGGAPAVAAAETESASLQPYHTSYGGNDDDERDLHILNWAANVALPEDEDESVYDASINDLASTDAYNETTSSEDESKIDPGAFASIPLKYLDPLSGNLMIDSVILPTSGRTVERESIEESLLEDPVDPWTKAPLKIEDVIPNATLKAQLQVFKAKRTATPLRPNQRMLRALAVFAKQAKKEGEDVETSEGSSSAASREKGVYQDGDHVSAQQHVLHYDGSEASSHVKTGSCKEASDCGCPACHIAIPLKDVRHDVRSKLREAKRAVKAANAANAANYNVNAISPDPSNLNPSTRSYDDYDHHSEPQPSLHYDGSRASSHLKASSCKEASDCVCRTCRISGPAKKVRDDRSKPLEVEYSGINETVNEAIARLRPDLTQHKPQRRVQKPAPVDPSSHNDSSLADASGNEGSFFSDEEYPDEDNAAHGSQDGSGGQEAADAAAPDGDGSSSGSSNRSPGQKSSSSSSNDQSSSENESNCGENRCNQWNGSHESSCGEPVCYNCHPELAYESVPRSSEPWSVSSKPPSLVDDDDPSDKDPSPSEVHTESDVASNESADESSSEHENGSEKEQSIVDDESSSNEDPTPSEIDAARHHGSDGSCGRPDCDDCHPENVFGQAVPSSSSSSGLGEELTHVDRDYAPQQVGRLDYGDEDQTMADASAAAEAGTGENGDGDVSEHSGDDEYHSAAEGEEAENKGGETQQTAAPLAPGQGYVEISRAEQQQADLFFRVSDGKTYGDEE